MAAIVASVQPPHGFAGPSSHAQQEVEADEDFVTLDVDRKQFDVEFKEGLRRPRYELDDCSVGQEDCSMGEGADDNDDANNKVQEALEDNDNDHNDDENNNNNDDDQSSTTDDNIETSNVEGGTKIPYLPVVEEDAEIDTNNANNKTSSESRKTMYGGLNNMGNTCYLNSALQMIASLDGFDELIRREVPQAGDSELRKTLLDVLERLQNGETVRPNAFKDAVDERSPLFIGYRQQDSHEFLTTLLDLLDEDYKKTIGSEDADAAAAADDDDEADVEMKDATEEAVEDTNDEMKDAEEVEQNEQESPMEEQVKGETDLPVPNDDIPATPVEKKPRLANDNDDGDKPAQEDENVVDASSPPKPAFKDLKFDDIETLLHGNGSSSSPTKEPTERKEPKCKLVGGRMSTAGVTLTRLEGGDTMPQEPSSTAEFAETEEQPMDDSADSSSSSSPVDSYFTTEVRVCLTCDSCKYRRSHSETYLHLSLEVGPNCSSLEEGLRKFFAPEKREVKCEKCFCETAMQTTEVTKLPRALLFHLKRFIVDVSPDYTSISYRKDQSSLSFGEEIVLDTGAAAAAAGGDDENAFLSEFLAADVSVPCFGKSSYGIRSVVNHIGSSASCGHYTADAKRRYESSTTKSSISISSNRSREWARFNDSYVSEISSEEAVEKSSQTAYMIMYELEQQ